MILLPGFPLFDSGGLGGTMGSLGTVMFFSLAVLLVSMEVGGGGGFCWRFVRRPVVFVMDCRSFVAVLSLAGADA